MRRFLTILIFAVLVVTAARGQTGLNVAQFFNEDYASLPSVTLVSLTGNRLNRDGIGVYKSISETGNDELADKIRRAVVKDGTIAKSKEVTYKDGKLYFGFYSLGGRKKERRYLLYLDRRASGKEKSTLVFIEGDLDEGQVKTMMNRQ